MHCFTKPLKTRRLKAQGELAGLFLALMAGIACAAGGQQTAPPCRITTLDYLPAPERGMPLVRVRLNNGSRNEAWAMFVVDTGFTQCLMSDRLARALNMAGEPVLREDGALDRFADGRPLQQVTAHLQVGDLATDLCPFLLLKAYRLDLLDCPLDGVLGWHFLSEHAMCLDFQAHRMTLWRGGDLSEAELKAAGMQGAIVIPRANRTPGSFDIEVLLGNQNHRRRTTLAVDTGGARTLISPQDARALDLEPTRIALPQRTIFGSLKANEANVPTLNFGPICVADLPARYLTQEHPNMPPHLGLDVLAHYRMLIDYPANKLYLKPIAVPIASSAPLPQH